MYEVRSCIARMGHHTEGETLSIVISCIVIVAVLSRAGVNRLERYLRQADVVIEQSILLAEGAGWHAASYQIQRVSSDPHQLLLCSFGQGR